MCYVLEKQLVLNRANLKVVFYRTSFYYLHYYLHHMTVAKIHQPISWASVYIPTKSIKEKLGFKA